MTRPTKKMARTTAVVCGTLALAGCGSGLDFDFRGALGGGVDTSDAARNARVAARPDADSRGVITYTDYQVAVARRGDTVNSVADRVGVPAAELARFNGLAADTALRAGEVVALPRTVDGAAAASSNAGTAGGTSLTPTIVDVSELAPSGATAAAASAAPDPVRHRVEAGETAFTIARLYNVPVAALQEWNGLSADLDVREGQLLSIPVVLPAGQTDGSVTAPGQGSLTPTPPSATRPQPRNLDVLPAAAASTTSAATASTAATSPAAPLGATTSASTQAETAMVRPVAGSIIRGYAKGRNEGIDIGAPAGRSVQAADRGRVAAISMDTNGVNLLVIQHDGGLLTVYTNISDISVAKGDRVQRGQNIAKVAAGSPSFLHFEVRRGLESVDPEEFI
ncbi:MAG: peptidoglycan DD-metalloendopeptidase family protein [Pseudomonadota bacterium]